MALLSGAAKDSLPDSSFAYIEPGGSKDKDGKTVPRSKRHFPIQDAAHVRDALARIAQGAKFGQQALPKVKAAAKTFGVDMGKGAGAVAEVKSFSLKLDSPPDDEGRFTGYAAVFGNVDKGNDLIESGAFKKSLQENPTVPILWSHNPDEPIGVSTYAAEDGSGLKVEGQLAMDVQRAREVHSLMKMGAIKGISIGYNTVKRNFKGQVRHLQEVALGEFSPVVFPMNTLAQVDNVKSMGGDYYGATGDVDCLLSVISSLTDYLASEVAEGDDDDVARVQSILPTLQQCLASELSDVSSDDSDDDDDPQSSAVEMMRESVELAVKKLTALLESHEPALGHSSEAGAATQDAAEPDDSTSRALIADMRATLR